MKRILLLLLTLLFVACEKVETTTNNTEPQEEETSYIDVTIPNTNNVFRMILVKAGTFTMGATAEQSSYALNNEKPSHKVILTEDFYIAETEVTQAQFQAVMGYNNSEFQYGGNYPAEWIGFNDANYYCQKLSELTGYSFMLPSEAQWEYAARGGHKSSEQQYVYAGDNDANNVSWHTTNSSNHTHPVKSKNPNVLGIYDMSGNVLEWCSDRYSSYESYTQTDPHGPSIGSYRVIRGGGWNSPQEDCRITRRSESSDDRPRWTGEYGMRVIMIP